MKKLLSILCIIGLSFSATPNVSLADDTLRPGDAYDIPVMYVHHYINETQTLNVTLVPPIRNNEEITIPAMSGAIFEFTRGGEVETIFASRVTVNSSTNIVTLTGSVIRDVCFNVARTLSGCGDGNTWSKGTEVRLVTSAKRLNRYVDNSRPNALNASGALSFYGSGSFAIPTFATTAARDQQLGASPSGPVRTACVVGDSCYYYLGGSWIKYGSGSTAVASTTVRGGVELATVADLSGSTVIGDSGAPLVVGTNLVIRHSTGALNNRNKVVATNNQGYLSGSLLGSGLPTSAKVLYGNQRWDTVTASGGNVLGRKSIFTDVGVTATSFAILDSGLSITGSVASGSLLHYSFFSDVNTSTNVDFGCNIVMTRGSWSGNIFADPGSGVGSGAYMARNNTAGDQRISYIISWTDKTQTGGTLTLTPHCRVNSATTATFNAPTRFSIFKIQ